MIIKLHGETSIKNLPNIIKDLITDIQVRAGIDPASSITLKDVELGVLFNINGEKMLLSVEHGGVKETFTIHVELDEAGNIKGKKDNEEESFLDEYSKAVALGLESPTTEEIESVYNDDDLAEVSFEVGGDLKAIHYKHKTEEGLFVVRYYRNGVLVGETGYGEKKKEA